MGLSSAFILAVFVPLIILLFIYQTDFYQVGKYHIILMSLVGGVAAYWFAFWANFALRKFALVDPLVVKQFVAPAVEEILKGSVLLFVLFAFKFTFSVDGALYGFATGIGFAIIENFEYAMDTPSIPDVLLRALSANLIHASSSAIIGIALSVFLLRKSRDRWLVLAFGLVLAIGQHMLFNIMVEPSISPLIATGIAILSFGLIFLALQRGKKQAQEWIKQKLGMEDRVTQGEVTAVDRLPSLDNLLFPVEERFGSDTANKVEKLLYLQARLGIKRKTLESYQKDAQMRNAVEAEIREMRSEMEQTRRSIGAYAMLFVRGLFADEMVSVWEAMQAKIRESSARNSGQKGGGLWSSLEERLKSPTDT